MTIKIEHYDGCLYDVINWAINRRNNEARKHPPEDFRKWIYSVLPPDCRTVVGYHLNFITPETPTDETGEWVTRFPHSHADAQNWPLGTTSCVTYLAVVEDGGEIGIGGMSKDDPYKFIKPELGQTIIFNAGLWHGVKPVKKGVRLSLVTTGLSDTNVG